MSDTPCTKLGIMLAGTLAIIGMSAKADTFGSGANAFTIDFATVGNPGNADDVNSPYAPNEPNGGTPFGGVAYTYRMGVTEVPEDWILKAMVSGLDNVIAAGSYTVGMKPAAFMTWFESAAFVNWLNTSAGHQAAYDLMWTGSAWTMNLWGEGQAWGNDSGAGLELNKYRHKDAYYFLPSEDEWYKAAYHKNNGATADYWDYATGSDIAPLGTTNGSSPGTAVYFDLLLGSIPDITEVDYAGGLSSYGTMGQNGNVHEWQESAFDGLNDSSIEGRTIRGGDNRSLGFQLRSSYRVGVIAEPSYSNYNVGFRIASVPEPSSALLLLGSGWMWLLKRRGGWGL